MSNSRNSIYLSASSLCMFVGLLLLSCSSSEEVSCGVGTELEGSQCVLINSEIGIGAGGEPGTTEEGVDTPETIILREIDQALELFAGAQSIGPISDTALLVSWDAMSNAGVSYHIYIAESEDSFSFGSPQAVAPEGASSQQLNGLEEGITYFVVVRPVFEDNEFATDAVALQSMPSNDDIAPSFSGVIAGTTVEGAGVNLSWDSAVDDLSPSELISYLIYFGETADFVTANPLTSLRIPTAVTTPGATSFELKPLPEANTEYYFVVRARDAAGNIDQNTLSVAVTSGADVEAPSFSGCNSAIERSASAIDVFFDPASDDTTPGDQIIYKVFASTTVDGHDFDSPNVVVTGGNSAEVVGLERDTQYFLICRAADPAGNIEQNLRVQSAKTKEDGDPPSFGGIVASANIAADSIDLQWNAASDTQSLADEIVYEVYVADAADGFDFETPTLTTEPGVLAVTVPDLQSNTSLFFEVLARDLAGNKSESTTPLNETTLVSLQKDIQNPIFSAKCATSGCHSGENPIWGLNLSSGLSHATLVGIDSGSALGSGVKRVTAGNADQNSSHLIKRINGSLEASAIMPASDDLLSADNIATIELWITQGALNN